jgi:endonuclease III
MTTGPSYERVFDRLKAAVGDWNNLLSIKLRFLKKLIAAAGLSNQKAPRLIAIAKRLDQDFGAVSLSGLGEMTDLGAERYLTSLPGVGVKTAKCVMMYSLSRQVLPVDTHVCRVAKRIGLVAWNLANQKLHDGLEEVILPGLRYSFHVNAVAHGRAVCKALAPLCADCPIQRLCASAQQTKAAAYIRSKACAA